MTFGKRDEKEIQRINRLQGERFDTLVQLFEPPLPEGVPERLSRIVAAARIGRGEVVLDVGAGTGILVPRIRAYRPGRIYACDLSRNMLSRLHRNYPEVKTLRADVRDLTLPDASVDAALINACYPNIADKAGAFANLARMIKAGGRLIVSHPMGRRFVDNLKKTSPFPLDDFPDEGEAGAMLAPFGWQIESVVDEPQLYILSARRRN